MSIFSRKEHRFLAAVANLGYCNPFTPERVDLERAALGPDFVAGGPIWSVSVSDPDTTRPNVIRLHQKLPGVIEKIKARLDAAPAITAEELVVYEESVHCLLYQRYYGRFVSAQGKYRFYREFLDDWNRLCQIPGKQFRSELDPAHVFACFRQIQRAFEQIFRDIIGGSMPAARLAPASTSEATVLSRLASATETPTAAAPPAKP